MIAGAQFMLTEHPWIVAYLLGGPAAIVLALVLWEIVCPSTREAKR